MRSMTRSEWTKAAMLVEAKEWAEFHGHAWRPGISRIPKGKLASLFLVTSGEYAGHGSWGRELLHVAYEREYVMNGRALARLLDPSKKLPVPKPVKLTEEQRKRERRRAAAKRRADQKKARKRRGEQGPPSR